jgi:hypothetical protein
MPVILHLIPHKSAEVIPKRRVYLIDYESRCHVGEYLKDIARKYPRCITRLQAFIDRFASHGWINVPSHFESIKGKSNLYELKPWGHRFFCFIDDNMLILSTACPKKSNNATNESRREIDKADGISRIYFAAKDKGEVMIDEDG